MKKEKTTYYATISINNDDYPVDFDSDSFESLKKLARRYAIKVLDAHKGDTVKLKKVRKYSEIEEDLKEVKIII